MKTSVARSFLWWLVALAFSFSGARAQTSEELIAEGRAHIVQRNWNEALQKFEGAVALEPENATASVLAGIARLFTAPKDPQISDLLDQLGLEQMGRELPDWAAKFTQGPDGTPNISKTLTGEGAGEVLRERVVPLLIRTGEDWASVQDPSFILALSAAETGLEAVWVDYGDVLLLRAAVRAVEYLLYTVDSLDLDVNWIALKEWKYLRATSGEELLADHPNLLTVAKVEDLEKARAAFEEAIELYSEASEFIRARPRRAVRLFNLDPEMAEDERDFRSLLSDLRRSAEQGVVLAEYPELSVDLSLHFEGAASPREWFPKFRGDAIVASSLPNHEFGGILVGYSAHEIEDWLARHFDVVPLLQNPVVEPGAVTLAFHLPAGMSYTIEASDDLRNWTELGSGLSGHAPGVLRDDNPGPGSARFYRIKELSRPVNDDFDDRVIVAGDRASILGSLWNAGREDGEPSVSGSWGGWLQQSIWWEWTAPYSGRLAVTTWDSAELVDVAVFQGDELSNLQRVGDTRLGLGFVPVNSGESYQIMAGSIYRDAGTVDLELELFPFPSNDEISNATAIRTDYAIIGHNLGAQSDGVGPGGGPFVWYSWSAPSTDQFALRWLGSDSPTSAVVLDGAPGANYGLVASGDLTASDTLLFDAVGRRQYLIGIRPFYPPDSNLPIPPWVHPEGTFGFKLVRATRPQNDELAQRTVLSGDNLTVTASNLGASAEVGEPDIIAPEKRVPGVEGRSVWWGWAAPASGTAIVSTKGSDFDTALAVFAAPASGPVDLLARSGGSPDSEVRFTTDPGMDYLIGVDGRWGEVGEITLHLEFFPPPRNDAFAEATEIFGLPVSVSGHNFGATSEPGEPAYTWSPPHRTVWWRWTAASSDAVEITADSDELDPIVRLYSGDSWDDLDLITQDFADARLTPLPGKTYWISVDDLFGEEGVIALTIDLVPPPANDNFADRERIYGGWFPGSSTSWCCDSNLGATREPDEPNHAGLQGGRSVWYEWVAPLAGTVSIATRWADFDTVLAVYTGDSLSTLAPIAADDDDSGNLMSHVTFPITADTAYSIAVAGKAGAMGEFGLELTVQQPPASRSPSSIADHQITVTVGGATSTFQFTSANQYSEVQGGAVVAAGTYNYTILNAPAGETRVVLTPVGNGEVTTVLLDFDTANTGTYTVTRGGQQVGAGNFNLQSFTPGGGGDGGPVTAPTSLTGRVVTITVESGTFKGSTYQVNFTSGTSLTLGNSAGNYTYTPAGRTANLMINYTSGDLANDSDTYNLTFTSPSTATFTGSTRDDGGAPNAFAGRFELQ